MTSAHSSAGGASSTPNKARASRESPLDQAGDPYVANLAHVALDGQILGQDRALATLGKALVSGHFPHAWIFHGPVGTGKCTVALRIAAIMSDPLSGEAQRAKCAPRTDTQSATLLRAGTHPDIKVIRAELAGTSSDRELRERKQNNIPVALLREHMIGGTIGSGARIDGAVFRSSVMGAGKAFIIDEAERLDSDGQNVLLKTLEEPPPGTTIILVTSSLDRLLPTVRSRCQSVGFFPLTDVLMEEWINANLGEVTGATRAFVQMYAAGSPGAAVTAVALDLHSLHAELSPMIDQLERGECPLAMGDCMNDFSSSVSDAAIKRNENASKEAANRRATGLAFSVIGAEVLRRLRASARMQSKLEYWTAVPGLIAEAERNLQANVNQKLVLANFVAQWATLGRKFA